MGEKKARKKITHKTDVQIPKCSGGLGYICLININQQHISLSYRLRLQWWLGLQKGQAGCSALHCSDLHAVVLKQEQGQQRGELGANIISTSRNGIGSGSGAGQPRPVLSLQRDGDRRDWGREGAASLPLCASRAYGHRQCFVVVLLAATSKTFNLKYLRYLNIFFINFVRFIIKWMFRCMFVC